MRRALAFVSLALAGCLGALAPDVGPLQVDPSTCPGDSDPTAAVHFAADIHDGVFQRNGCLMCHTEGGKGLTQSGLDLSTYATLRTGGGRTGIAIVVDGNPCASLLVQKLEPSPPFGRRMPYNGPPYLSDADLQRVRDWIAEGALDD